MSKGESSKRGDEKNLSRYNILWSVLGKQEIKTQRNRLIPNIELAKRGIDKSNHSECV